MGIAYNTSIVRDGLVLHLDAANVKSYPGSGTAWNDLSGNGINATLVNAPPYDTANGGSFVCDGYSKYATTPIPINNTQPYTILMMVKPTTLDMTSGYRAYNPLGTMLVGPGPVWNPGIWATHNTLRSHCRSNYIDNQIAWDDLHTSMVGMVYNGTMCYNIFDAVILTSNYISTAYAPPTPTILNIGAYGLNTTHNFDGRIYDVMFYNRVLSQAEVTQNFEALRGRYGI